MIGDHHGRGAGRATLLVRAADGILGTHRTRQVWSGEPNATLVAELEGLASGGALDRVFKQALGQAPMKYLVDWRMTLARDLLLTQNLPMTEIADRIGHSSLYAFVAAFRRQHGQPPGRWRQQQASTGFAGILTH